MQAQVYTPEFLAVHSRHAANMPAHVFYEAIGKNLRQFENPSNVFLPVSLDIALTGARDANAVRIKVAPSDAGWYSKLVDAVKTMMNIKKPITIATVTGQDISTLSHQQLVNVGELMVVDASGKQLIGSQLVAPPRHMAVDKLVDVKNWYTAKVRDGVVSLVTNQLKDLEESQLDSAMVKNGKIQLAIASFIKDSVPGKDWKGFLDTYARDTTAKAANLADDGHAVANTIARGYLQQIRSAMRANRPHIESFFAAKEAAALTGTATDEDRPLFGKHANPGIGASVAASSKFNHVATMWREVVEDAMYHATTARIPVDAIYNGHQRSPVKTPPGGPATPIVQDQQHPFLRANMASSIAERAYPGNSDRALAMYRRLSFHFVREALTKLKRYHLFSGKHLPTAPESELLPTKVGNRLSALPKLVPISSLVGDSVPGSNLAPMPKLVPISSLVGDSASAPSQMPKLVPISSLVGESTPESNLAPMPKLVPISSLVGDSTPSQLPKLVPISSLVGNSADLVGCGCKKDKKDKPKDVESNMSYRDALLGARARASRRGMGAGRTTTKSTAGRNAPEMTNPVASALIEEPLFASGYDDAPNLDDFI